MSVNNTIVEATPAESEQIATLVNQAYRPSAGISGWTHELGLVTGNRINPQQVKALFKSGSTILVMHVEQAVVACVHLEQHGDICSIGMLATLPALQAQGVGKQMLQAAEDMAMQRYHANIFNMSVLSSRPELLAYYQRRGYQPTGITFPYPIDAGVGIPQIQDLHVLELCKRTNAFAV